MSVPSPWEFYDPHGEDPVYGESAYDPFMRGIMCMVMFTLCMTYVFLDWFLEGPQQMQLLWFVIAVFFFFRGMFYSEQYHAEMNK